jgi:hypothetical protein
MLEVVLQIFGCDIHNIISTYLNFETILHKYNLEVLN